MWEVVVSIDLDILVIMHKNFEYITIQGNHHHLKILLAANFKILMLLQNDEIVAAGFGGAGVIGGSAAATAQSYIYGAWTGGVFSTLQSAGEL